MLAIENIDPFKYDQLCQKSQVIVNCKHGPKLLETADGQILKFFYPRKLISSNQIWPYAIRFVKNALALDEKKIASVQVNHLYYYPGKHCHIVSYDKLAGTAVRTLVEGDANQFLSPIASYLAKLHHQGIFFRGIHLGNLLWKDNNEIALIDISDLKIRRAPLSIWQRKRNLAHMIINKEDHPLLREFGIDKFIKLYLQACQLPEFKKKYLAYFIKKYQEK